MCGLPAVVLITRTAGPWDDQGVNERSKPTDTKTRFIGQALSGLVARYPGLWPVFAGSVTRFFDARAEHWDQRTGAGSSEHLAPLAAAVGRIDSNPERILDLGCGTGEGTLFLSREFPRASVRGVDISEAMVEIAQSKIGLDPDARVAFKAADASRLPFKDDSFDLVAQINLPLFSPELGRVLRPGGRLILVSSHGSDTPFHTSGRLAIKSLGREGLALLDRGIVGSGTFLVFGDPSE